MMDEFVRYRGVLESMRQTSHEKDMCVSFLWRSDQDPNALEAAEVFR